MKVVIMAVALVIPLCSSFAHAKEVRHKPSIRTYGLLRAVPPVRSGPSNPNYGKPTRVSSGGYLWNGRSAAEVGSEMLFNQRTFAVAGQCTPPDAATSGFPAMGEKEIVNHDHLLY